MRLREIAERLIQLEMLTEDGGAMAEQAAKDALGAIQLIQMQVWTSQFLLELAMEANVACTDTGFFANETDEKTGTSVLLASVTDLAEADRPVRRYDIKYLMEFQAHFTDKPTLPDMPWDKLPISRTAPELTSTPDKRSVRSLNRCLAYFIAFLMTSRRRKAGTSKRALRQAVWRIHAPRSLK